MANNNSTWAQLAGGAVGGIAQGALNFASSQYLIKQQQEQQKELMDKAYAQNQQALHDSPLAQLAGVKAAGMNPALMNQGNFSSPTMGTPQAPTAPSPDLNVFDSVTKLVDAIKTAGVDTDKAGTEADKNRQDIENLKSTQNQIDENIKLIKSNIEKTDAEKDKIDMETALKTAETSIKNFELAVLNKKDFIARASAQTFANGLLNEIDEMIKKTKNKNIISKDIIYQLKKIRDGEYGEGSIGVLEGIINTREFYAKFIELDKNNKENSFLTALYDAQLNSKEYIDALIKYPELRNKEINAEIANKVTNRNVTLSEADKLNLNIVMSENASDADREAAAKRLLASGVISGVEALSNFLPARILKNLKGTKPTKPTNTGKPNTNKPNTNKPNTNKPNTNKPNNISYNMAKHLNFAYT